MPITPARAAAFDILLRVQREDAYGADLLHSGSYRKLSPADHGLSTELVMGVLRWRSWLDAALAKISSQSFSRLDAEVRTALRLAAYQLLFLDRIPERAAVHESVEMMKRARKRSAAPFVNAVLRKLVQNKAAMGVPGEPGGDLHHLSVAFAHPDWLVERWAAAYGLQTTQSICQYDQKVPDTSIQLEAGGLEEELERDGIILKPGWLLRSARRVSPGEITETAAFRQGRVHMQDEASQLVALLVGKGRGLLDCCAAPGGKTRILADRNPASLVVAVELHPHRARLLQKLVSSANVRVIAADARALPTGTRFERVLADVPCSGTGTLARNPEIKWRLQPSDLPDLQARQVSILQAAMSQVAAGGKLVYSSCSLEREENAEVVETCLERDGGFRLLNCRSELERLKNEGELAWEAPDSLLSGPYLRTIPGIHPCDGFFAAVLEKL